MTECPLCAKECISDASLIHHMKRHTWDESALLKLIAYIHKRFEEPPPGRLRDGYRPWDMRKNKPMPRWWRRAKHLRDRGFTLQEIATKFEVTRERVRQVLNVLRQMP